MHKSSMQLMNRFMSQYLKQEDVLKILDVGSYDVNGAYKPLFKNEKWTYTGLDIAAGPNVDIVVQHQYQWMEIDDESFDVIISGQCLEHVQAPWLTVKEIYRACKPGGKCCVIVPWRHQYHRYPIDCYRFLPDGLRYLMHDIAGFKEIECNYGNKESEDCWFIGEK